jgi:hypothetical protein
MMIKNVGDVDRGLRVVAAAVLIVGGVVAGPGGWLPAVLYLIGAVLAVTAAVSFCPLYALLGVSTRRHTSGADKRQRHAV